MAEARQALRRHHFSYCDYGDLPLVKRELNFLKSHEYDAWITDCFLDAGGSRDGHRGLFFDGSRGATDRVQLAG
jgi:hypothetical protein